MAVMLINRTCLLLLVLFTTASGILFALPKAHGGLPAPKEDRAEQKNRQGKPPVADTGEEAATNQEENPEEAAPAAVSMDTTGDSPVILALYQATRETKETMILEKLTAARGLIEKSSDIQKVDALGRTPLHWAVFGSSYTTKPGILAAYTEITDLLISRGVNINREDAYHNTALDYLLYSPSFEMQTLLIEQGATSGNFSADYYPSPDSTGHASRGPAGARSSSGNAGLEPGMIVRIRLRTPVWSDKSRTGDPVEAAVTAPVRKAPATAQAGPQRVALAPGTKIEGTILFARRAPDKYSRPILVLDFANIQQRGSVSPLYAQVLEVENARETVHNNVIFGIVQPHANTKSSVAISAVSMANPLLSYAIKGTQAAYGLSLRREIYFPAGTDLTLQVTRPSRLKEKETWRDWPVIAASPKLTGVVQKAPLRAVTTKDAPSDLTNLLFIGKATEIEAAFEKAGWHAAHGINPASGAKTFAATIRQSGYKNAPVSTLRLNGVAPEYAYQKGLDTFAMRHHIRIWKLGETYNGRAVWVGAATHDIAIGNAGKGTKWFHRIDPRIDRERAKVKRDLLYSGVSDGYALVPRPNAPLKSTNGTGDAILTDGKMMVLSLSATKK